MLVINFLINNIESCSWIIWLKVMLA